MSAVFSYDRSCRVLADQFLPADAPDSDRHQLAQVIQTAIEDNTCANCGRFGHEWRLCTATTEDQ